MRQLRMLHLFSPAAAAFLLDRRSPTTSVRPDEPDFLAIRCPMCAWQPKPSDRWLCSPGCEHHWNTFQTAGICPSCLKHWHETACLSCRAWSAHERWYQRTE